MHATIYHNPRCSKSRQTLALLQEKGVSVEVIEYLKTPPTKADLQQLLSVLNLSAREILRIGEAAYTEQNLADPTLSEEALLDVIVTDPILLQRPIVVVGDKAVIGRPPENVLTLL